MSPAKSQKLQLSGRPSRSAEASRRAELARIAAMSPIERMALALALGQRRRSIERARAQQKAP